MVQDVIISKSRRDGRILSSKSGIILACFMNSSYQILDISSPGHTGDICLSMAWGVVISRFRTNITNLSSKTGIILSCSVTSSFLFIDVSSPGHTRDICLSMAWGLSSQDLEETPQI